MGGEKRRQKTLANSSTGNSGRSTSSRSYAGKSAADRSIARVEAGAHVKGVNFYRDAAKVRKVNLYKGGKPTRDKDGVIVKEAQFQNKLPSGTVSRVAPNRRWFENTRVIGQEELTKFREAMSVKANDPYTFLLRQHKLPMSLLQDPAKNSRMHILETETFQNTFGPKAQRKKPRFTSSTLDDLAQNVSKSLLGYNQEKDEGLLSNVAQVNVEANERAWDPIFKKGQSKRIWNELYKVLDSSDVVIHVLDARDPMGTRCRNVETYLKKEAPHKHLIFVLNKCDLIPTWATARWVQILSAEHPTLAFHASITNSFGKGSLIQLLRQFSLLHSDRKQISVGFIGYPNTGKSSIINTLRAKKVCTVAPIPGETKVWQYITLMRRIYLIDCPGIVYPSKDDKEVDVVLRGVVRVENVTMPEQYIEGVITKCKKVYLEKTYGVKGWNTSEEFLTMIAKKSGKLLKGGEPDVSTVAKTVLNDWIRGKIPFFVAPPVQDSVTDGSAVTNISNGVAVTNSAASGGEVDAGGSKKKGVQGVQQFFSKIVVTTDFEKEDMVVDISKPSDEKTVAENIAEEEEKITDWDEVFAGDKLEDNDDQEETIPEDVVQELASKGVPSGRDERMKKAKFFESLDLEGVVDEEEATSAANLAPMKEENPSKADDPNARDDSQLETENKTPAEPETSTPTTRSALKKTTKKEKTKRSRNEVEKNATESDPAPTEKKQKKAKKVRILGTPEIREYEIDTTSEEDEELDPELEALLKERFVDESFIFDEDELEEEEKETDKKPQEKPKKQTSKKTKPPMKPKHKVEVFSEDEEDEDEDSELEEEDSDSDSEKTKKEARMKTNKQKVGKNFYDSANVKNRNRNKDGEQGGVKGDPRKLVSKMRMSGNKRRTK
ncbi:GTPase required for pre-60S ribosomal subunit nuclear export and maturation [Nowakowskiella sp. JEL0407]|nr:GTPase required for pre-60S ribosomal subunit nuclear export and maturation [Nowakowskiella sp. JEL0407]